MPLIRDDDQERQERIDQLVKQLAEAGRSVEVSNKRAAKIAREIAELRVATQRRGHQRKE
jgi:uncharacterized protein YoxC